MRRFICSLALFMCIMLMTGSLVELVAQGPAGGGVASQVPSCRCTYKCPDIYSNPPYTLCPEEWTSANKTEVLKINLDLIGEVVDVEVHYCCRVRATCARYVNTPVYIGCETAITCIRVSKEKLLDYAPVGAPISDKVLRTQLMEGILNWFMCNNPCKMGLPQTSGQAYEWVFSFPSCLYWEKTNDRHWCLTSCGPRYCVHAFAVKKGMYLGRDEDNNLVYQSIVVEYVKDKFAFTPQSCSGEPNCTPNGCLDKFKPDCANWLWRLER